MDGKIGRTAQILGFAGLIPQLLAVFLVAQGGEWRWIALAGSYAYAALIFSFLGGVWWGQAISQGRSGNGVSPMFLGIGVLPSLIGFALFLPWTLGWDWPGPSLFWLGVLIMLSPLIDRKLGMGGAGWLRLRWYLSLGLGTLTVIMGVWSIG